MTETFNQAARQVALETAELVIRKQRAYGTDNILNCPAGVDLGIIVRLYDKLGRWANLSKAGGNPDWESLEDTIRDIIGYGLVAAMVHSDCFTLPLESEE